MTDTDDTKRQARREQIAHLLFRAACGVLTADEGAMLRAAVEREFDAAPTPEQAAASGGTRTASDVLVQHDVTRKAMCDALGAGYHLNWQQLVDAAQRSHDANAEWQAEAEQLRTALATERGAHNEHRRSLAILHGMSPDADWLNVTAAVTSVLHARDRDHRFLTEARRLRDEACGLLDKHQLDLAHVLGRDRCDASWGELISMAERARQAETEAIRARKAAERFAEASGTRAYRADAEARRNRDAWRNARRRAALMTAERDEARHALKLWIRAAGQERERAEQADATLTAVRALHTNEQWHCGTCADEYGSAAPWPCPTAAALGDPQPADDPCAHGCRQAADDHTRLSQELDPEPKPREVCCVCGCPDITYHNCNEQPFCCRCAKCCEPPVLCSHGCQPPADSSEAAEPEPEQPPAADWTAFLRRPCGEIGAHPAHRYTRFPYVLDSDVYSCPGVASSGLREQPAEPLLRGGLDAPLLGLDVGIDLRGTEIADLIRRIVRRGGAG